ncbi:hypothetical protein PCE1_004312 [Barthelona sp. PCE]
MPHYQGKRVYAPLLSEEEKEEPFFRERTSGGEFTKYDEYLACHYLLKERIFNQSYCKPGKLVSFHEALVQEQNETKKRFEVPDQCMVDVENHLKAFKHDSFEELVVKALPIIQQFPLKGEKVRLEQHQGQPDGYIVGYAESLDEHSKDYGTAIGQPVFITVKVDRRLVTVPNTESEIAAYKFHADEYFSRIVVDSLIKRGRLQCDFTSQVSLGTLAKNIQVEEVEPEKKPRKPRRKKIKGKTVTLPSGIVEENSRLAFPCEDSDVEMVEDKTGMLKSERLTVALPESIDIVEDASLTVLLNTYSLLTLFNDFFVVPTPSLNDFLVEFSSDFMSNLWIELWIAIIQAGIVCFDVYKNMVAVTPENVLDVALEALKGFVVDDEKAKAIVESISFPSFEELFTHLHDEGENAEDLKFVKEIVESMEFEWIYSVEPEQKKVVKEVEDEDVDYEEFFYEYVSEESENESDGVYESDDGYDSISGGEEESAVETASEDEVEMEESEIESESVKEEEPVQKEEESESEEVVVEDLTLEERISRALKQQRSSDKGYDAITDTVKVPYFLSKNFERRLFLRMQLCYRSLTEEQRVQLLDWFVSGIIRTESFRAAVVENVENSISTRIIPLGYDRNRRRYWRYPNSTDIYVDRYFEIAKLNNCFTHEVDELLQSETNEALWGYFSVDMIESLKKTLDVRGIRERGLHEALTAFQKEQPKEHEEVAEQEDPLKYLLTKNKRRNRYYSWK